MHKKRAYNAESRKIQAKQTKDRILDIAKKQFATKGFDNVTIEELAHAAGVSVPTIYAVFQSKKGVLHALMEQALEKDQYEDLVQKVSLEKTLKGRLEIAARISRKLYDAERKQISTFRDATVLSPEFKIIEMEREKRRYQRQEKTLKEMAKEKALMEGLSIKKARDILWAFTGRDLYRLLVIEQGWSSDEYEKWLAQSLNQMLSRKVL